MPGGTRPGVARDTRIIVRKPSGTDQRAAHALLAWPALWSVPLAFLTMVLVSLATPGRVPAGTAAILARFHLPEELRAEVKA